MKHVFDISHLSSINFVSSNMNKTNMNKTFSFFFKNKFNSNSFITIDRRKGGGELNS